MSEKNEFINEEEFEKDISEPESETSEVPEEVNLSMYKTVDVVTADRDDEH